MFLSLSIKTANGRLIAEGPSLSHGDPERSSAEPGPLQASQVRSLGKTIRWPQAKCSAPTPGITDVTAPMRISPSPNFTFTNFAKFIGTFFGGGDVLSLIIQAIGSSFATCLKSPK